MLDRYAQTVLSKRRVVIDLTPAGWIGWLLLALLSALLLLVFFLFAAILVPIALIVLGAAACVYWLRCKVRGKSARVDMAPEAACGADNPGGDDTVPPKRLPPPAA